jgi:CRP-like cAMP-binding protein
MWTYAMAMTSPAWREAQDDVRLVDRINLFSRLGEDEKDKLESTLKLERYARNKFIFHEDDPAQRFYYVLEGFVSIQLEQRICFIAHTGDFLGLEGVFSDSCTHPFGAKAETKSRVISLSSAAFRNLLHGGNGEKKSQTAQLLEQLLIQAHRRLYDTYDLLRAQAGGSVSAVAHMLYRFIATGQYDVTARGWRIRERLSEEKMGEISKYSRSTIQRVLAQLEEDGIIDKSYRHITILDPERLRQLKYESARRTKT